MDAGLDHLIWGCSSLDEGVAMLEDLTGVRAAYSGAHANGQTHNALMSLGKDCYLEIIAPTGPPHADDDGFTTLVRSGAASRLLTWCARSARPLAQVAGLAEGWGWEGAAMVPNSRERPDGVALRWACVSPRVAAFGPSLPFFIDWLGSPHPALTAPTGARLAAFSVGHPEAPALTARLGALGVECSAHHAATPSFTAVLDTPKGWVRL